MKYTSKDNLLEELKTLPYFKKELIYDLGKNEKTHNLTDSTLDTYISRFLKHKDIISLKRGFYVTTNFYNKHRNDTSYLFYLSNILRSPSYITSWTALQYYNLATEVIHTITAVTTKVTRSYKTKIGAFSYQSIKKDLFSDFNLIKNGDFEFFIASPAKSLFDLLYFKTKQFKNIKFTDVDYLIEELRIDMAEMDENEKNKFYSMLKKYIKYE
jgi:predicted transcriptional regulator of viral defense system